MSTLKNSDAEEDSGLIDLASRNNNLKLKITHIIESLDTIDPIILENEISSMLENMMNFFAQYVEEIPSLDSLTPEQQEIIISRFKAISKSLKKRKIKSANEMTQVFVFTVLNCIGENVENLRDLTAEEILQKKHKNDFRKFLRNAAEFEIYQITQEKLDGKDTPNNFITNSIKLGVKEALKDMKLDFNMEELDKEALKVLDDAHKAFHKSKQTTYSKHK